MIFSTLAVFCEHRYFENGHEMPWGRGQKHTFNGICRGFCAPSCPKLVFEKKCFYRQFFSSVANSWNKSLSTLFFPHTYWYIWLNNCGLGRPSMRVFTRPIVFDPVNSWGNMSTHVPRKVYSVSTRMSLQWMNHQESNIKNVITHTHTPPLPPTPAPTNTQLQWRWTIKSVLSRKLSHPPHTPPKPPQPTPSVSTPMSLHEDEP